jgi:hypothetical protein
MEATSKARQEPPLAPDSARVKASILQRIDRIQRLTQDGFVNIDVWRLVLLEQTHLLAADVCDLCAAPDRDLTATIRGFSEHPDRFFRLLDDMERSLGGKFAEKLSLLRADPIVPREKDPDMDENEWFIACLDRAIQESRSLRTAQQETEVSTTADTPNPSNRIALREKDPPALDLLQRIGQAMRERFRN